MGDFHGRIEAMKPNWVAVEVKEIDIGHGVKAQHYYGSHLPPERRMVLVQIDKSEGNAPCVAVGYLKFAAGDEDSPYFVVPGARVDFVVTHWADCLGDDFEAPLWAIRNDRS